MDHVWPVSEDIAEQVLGRFLKTKSRAQVFAEPSLFDGSEQVGLKDSKIGNYKEGRNRIDLDGTSHLSYVPCPPPPPLIHVAVRIWQLGLSPSDM